MANTNTSRLVDGSHKHLREGNAGIVICAFTRRATNNIRRNVPKDMQPNCITIHKLLEYSPVYYETVNDEGMPVKTMAFEPTRTSFKPLDTGIQTIIIEEASMPSVSSIVGSSSIL